MKMMKNNINIKYKKSNILQTVKYSTDSNSKDLSIISVKFYKNVDAQKPPASLVEYIFFR